MASGAVLAVLALVLAGCGEEPTPPRLIGFSPAVLTVPGGEAIAISVEYEENDFALQDFQWTAAAGEIEGNGAPSITYHAPSEPGDYKIAVTAAYGDEDAAVSQDSLIKVTEAVAAAPPAVAETSEPGPQPAEPAQGADRATAETAAEPAAPAGEAVEEPAVAERTTEPPVVEEAESTSEATAPAAGQAVEEAASATEEATEKLATAVARGPERAAEAVEEAAKATVAAVRNEVEAAGAATEQAARDASHEVAAVAEEARGDTESAARQAGASASAETAAPGGQAATAERRPEVAALTEEPAATAAPAVSRLDQILDKHRLTAVVQIAFQPFSFYGEDGRRTGFDVDMVREFARRWLDDPTAVTFLPVPDDARIPTLQKGRADIIAAALTKTPARAEEVDFSLTYFKDGQQLLVREDSAIADVCDLRGRKVAAIRGSTSLDNIQAAAQRCGFKLANDLVTFRRHDDAVEALLEGQVEAYTSDGVALENLAEGRRLKVVGNHFSEERYGFAVPEGDQRLLQLVNHTLEEMERDGTYAAIYEKWFGDTIRPYPLEESETAAATEVAALATTSASAIVEPRTAPADPVDTYVVQAGDTLSRIAGKVYGDVSPASWQRIYQANRAVIGDNPSRIKVGMELAIPQ
jgi:polar amino acid transport system substrate-binding protein